MQMASILLSYGEHTHPLLEAVMQRAPRSQRELNDSYFLRRRNDFLTFPPFHYSRMGGFRNDRESECEAIGDEQVTPITVKKAPE